jgi:hypothetical protein
MSEMKVTRRGRGGDAIYFASAKNRYVGSISLGHAPDGKRIRRKVFGKTKQEVRDGPKALHQEMEAGVKSSKTYTVREAVEDWLREGLDGTSERTRTLYEGHSAGWQPVTTAGFDPAQAGRPATRSTSGAQNGTAVTPRPESPAGPSHCRAGAWRPCASSRTSRSKTDCRPVNSGRSTVWSSRPRSVRR